MFRMKLLEVVNWDYWQRMVLPLDANIVTLVGPNGSGKTTTLDALRTILHLNCSDKRDYKQYIRHNGRFAVRVFLTRVGRLSGWAEQAGSVAAAARHVDDGTVQTTECGKKNERNGKQLGAKAGRRRFAGLDAASGGGSVGRRRPSGLFRFGRRGRSNGHRDLLLFGNAQGL